MRKSIALIHIIISSITSLVCAAGTKTITIHMAPGTRPVYGALYYVQSHAAQRVGQVKLIEQEQQFNLPVVTIKARKYLILSYDPQLLKEVFTQPRATPGVLLVALPCGKHHDQQPLTLQEGQLGSLLQS
jgi:hypothetical protein